MALDSRFVLCPSLQELFRDKDTGLPLRSGYVEFYKDQARATPKDVYKLSGSPPNYSYTNIGNVVDLTSIGSFSDNGNPANDIVPFLFPYDGTPDDSDGTIELYYARVYNADGVFQFSREAWPPIVAAAESTNDLTNYIRNGQFKVHNDIPASPNDTPYEAGEIRQAITDIAPGGWTFERPGGSTAKDIVLFETFGDYVSNPTASPRFAARIKCESPSAGDAYKDLRFKFQDVNKFASETQKYTYAFTGKSNTGSSLSVSLVLIKNYGTGGDTEEETPIANFTITNTFTIIQTPQGFVFGDNEGKSIGVDDDDFVQLALRFPTNAVFDVSVTDFIDTPNVVLIESFPQTTDEDFIRDAMAGGMERPAYDGSTLYLPVLEGPKGFVPDRSIVGKIFATISMTAEIGELMCDGDRYDPLLYTDEGIPYSRVWTKIYNTTYNMPIYGTGLDYLTSYTNNVAGQLRLWNNTKGAVTATADGSAPTGFTFTTPATGASTYDFTGFQIAGNVTYVMCNTIGTTTAPGAGTSGFTVTWLRPTPPSAVFKTLTSIVPTAAAGLAGDYFLISNTTIDYYVWFRVDGAGADPAVGGRTGIRIDLLSTWDANTVGAVIAEVLSGFQVSNIAMTAASTVPASSFFTFSTTEPANFYVWYRKDGTGTDPAQPGKIGIRVDILTADTAAQVALKTQIQLNSKYFAVPDFRGQFLRGFDLTGVNDPDYTKRFNPFGIYLGVLMGQNQLDELLSHGHDYIVPNTGGAGGSPPGTDTTALDDTAFFGGAQNRPINSSVNYVIKI